MAQIGTAYVDVQGDFSSLNSQVNAALGPLTSKFGKVGKAAAVGLAGIGVAAVGAGKALYSIGEQFDDAYDKISTRTGSTGESLEALKDDFRDVVSSVPTDFESASTAIGDLNSQLGLTGEPLREVSKNVLELSRITETDLSTNVKALTRLFGDWGISSDEMAEHMDKLFRLSQETGTEVSSLAEQMVQFGSPLRQLGFDFETSAAMFAKFEQEGVNVQTLMPGLKMGLGNLVQPSASLATTMKNLGISAKDPAVAFRQVMEEMSKMESDSDRLGLAMMIFGKRAGADLAAAVEEGRFSFEDLINVMEHGTNTIQSAGEDTMDFTEQWQLFKNKAMVALEPLAAKVFNTLGKGMEWIAKHPDTVKNLAIAIGGLTASFVVLKATMLTVGAITSIASAFRTLAGAIAMANTAAAIGIVPAGGLARVMFALLHPIKAATAAIRLLGITTRMAMLATGVGALIVAAGLIILNWDKVKKALGAVWSWIKGAAKDVGGFLKKVFGDVVDFIKKIPGWIKDGLSTLWDIITWPFKKAAEWIFDRIKDVIEFIGNLPGKIKDILVDVGEFFFAPFKWAAEKIKNVVEDIKGWVKDAIEWLKKLIDKILDAAKAAANSALGATDGRKYIPENAKGTRNWRGGMTIVGEEGPELVSLPRGSAIYSAPETRSILSGGGGPASRSGGTNVKIEFADGMGWLEQFIKVQVDENDRSANHFSRAGLVPG